MTTTTFAAAKLLSSQRIELAIQVMAGAAKISHLADENDVSLKFVYQQRNKAQDALDSVFAQTAAADDGVLFSLPVTKAFASIRQTQVSKATGIPLGSMTAALKRLVVRAD